MWQPWSSSNSSNSSRTARRLPAARPRSPDVGGFGHGSQNNRGRRKANITSFCSASHVRHRPAVLQQLMSVDLFNKIVDKVTLLIRTQKTNWLDPLPPALQVAISPITLRHVATGDSYPPLLSFNFSAARRASLESSHKFAVWVMPRWDLQAGEEGDFVTDKRRFGVNDKLG